MSDLIPLCRRHHDEVHRIVRQRVRHRGAKARGRNDGLAVIAIELRRAYEADERPGLALQTRPPSHLRGKAKGHWYRDRYRRALAELHPDFAGDGPLRGLEK